MTAPDVYTLADFTPDGHLRETCAPLFDGYSCLGNGKPEPDWRDCSRLLYDLAARQLAPPPSGWSEDEHTDSACDHDWNPVSGAKEVCPRCGGVRAWVEHEDAVNALLADRQARIDAVRAEAERAQDGRGSWVHATRLLALIHDDPAERPAP